VVIAVRGPTEFRPGPENQSTGENFSGGGFPLRLLRQSGSGRRTDRAGRAGRAQDKRVAEMQGMTTTEFYGIMARACEELDQITDKSYLVRSFFSAKSVVYAKD